GAYRDYLHPGETVLPIPFAWALGGQSMLWQASAHMRFNMLGGYWGVHVAPSYTIDPAISSAPPLPIVNELLGFAPPDKRSPHELNSLLVSHEVTAVLVDPTSPFNAAAWPPVLLKAGWRVVARVGGIDVYRRSTG
ncbi:MAG: hypothetical protein ACREPS_10855, partial [Rhodanobacteraceae bacterium]